MKRQLFWFRTDLRLNDNRGLLAALKAGPTLAVYVATPGQWQEHDDAPVKLDLWRRSLAVLEQDLANHGVRLCFLQVPDYAAVPAALNGLCRELEIDHVHWNREYPLNERRRDQAVSRKLEALEIGFSEHDDRLLVAPEQVLTRQGQPFRVFTPFARQARRQLSFAALEDVGSVAARHAHEIHFPFSQPTTTLALEELDWPTQQPHWRTLWPAGERAALDALDTFCEDRVRDYHQHRDLPAIEGTSRLSPYLACGSLSGRQCWRAAGQGHDGQGMESWRNELLWRDFYQYVMLHYPHVCRGRNWREDLGGIPWRHDREAFKAWCEGRTGYPIIDAAMRQLLATGWMHNRLRMVTAMFLSKTLLIDWRWGEQWFMQHLVDGDFASNNGGWQWSASTGTDAVPYFRIFNPVTQSRRFDPEGAFLHHYLPELEALAPGQVHDPGRNRPRAYPAPIVDLKVGRERALAAFKAG